MPPKSKKWARKSKKGQKRARDPQDDRGQEWVPNKRSGVILRSPIFEAYYRAQQIVPVEEWKAFMTILRDPLPACFRINLDCDYADVMLAQFEGFAAKVESQDANGVEAIKRLGWFPDGKAYQLGVDRRSLRRNENYEAFHEFVKMHTDIGTITRQEAVSMIPPIALDVQSHHKVLDMCAAPGSKTSQMLEALLRGASLKGEVEPSGFVIANDADTNRAYMLVHQCKRLSTANLCVTTHQAQHFPGLVGYARGVGPFDRVLCDVPCSGDGTVRKTMNIWRSWLPTSGLGLHALQLQIARRGAALMSVGGMMVYSTCSLNPIEDEAVVAALIKEGQGSIELVDPRPLLPGLKSRAGLHTWKVIDCINPPQRGKGRGPKGEAKPKEGEAQGEGEAAKPPVTAPESTDEDYGHVGTVDEQLQAAGLKHYQSLEDLPEEKRKWRSSVFPPSAEEAAAMRLELCMRLLPHDQNTGGFFIALLKKVAPSPIGGKPTFASGKPKDGPAPQAAADAAEEEGEVEAEAEEGEEEGNGEPKAQKDAPDAKAAEANGKGTGYSGKKGRSSFVPQSTFEPLPDDAWEAINEFYGLREDFPRKQLLLRNGASKVVTYVSKSVAEGLEVGKDARHQLVHIGVKLFWRDSKDRDTCPYRVVQEGLPFVINYLTKRVVEVNCAELCSVVHNTYIYLGSINESTRAVIAALKVGGFVMSFKPEAQPGQEALRFDVVVWKGVGDKLNLMSSKFDTADVTCRLKAFGHWQEPPPEENKDDTKGEGEEDGEEGGEGEGEEGDGGEEGAMEVDEANAEG